MGQQPLNGVVKSRGNSLPADGTTTTQWCGLMTRQQSSSRWDNNHSMVWLNHAATVFSPVEQQSLNGVV